MCGASGPERGSGLTDDAASPADGRTPSSNDTIVTEAGSDRMRTPRLGCLITGAGQAAPVTVDVGQANGK